MQTLSSGEHFDTSARPKFRQPLWDRVANKALRVRTPDLSDDSNILTPRRGRAAVDARRALGSQAHVAAEEPVFDNPYRATRVGYLAHQRGQHFAGVAGQDDVHSMF